MFRFFLLAATAFLAAAQCPVLHTKTGLRKTINGGKTVTLTVKVTNRGATFNDGGFALQLPSNVAYKSVRVSPKLTTSPSFEQDDNGMVAWAGIAMHAKKTRTFRVKLAFDKCAGDDPVPSKHNKTTKAHRELFGGSSMFSTGIGVVTFTGPINDMQCMVSKTVPVSHGVKATDGALGTRAPRSCSPAILLVTLSPTNTTCPRCTCVGPRQPPTASLPSLPRPVCHATCRQPRQACTTSLAAGSLTRANSSAVTRCARTRLELIP